MEYYRIFGLTREPFSNSPDPDLFFKSREHQACLHHLEIAIRLRRGLNVVLGDIGTGKTTLCRQLVRELSQDPSMLVHLVLDPSFDSAQEFLSSLHAQVTGNRQQPGSVWAMKEEIKQALFQQGVTEEKTVVLILDEGQKISTECLEILRELLNYETNTFKLLQIVLFAQLEFERQLRELPNFTDRINLIERLHPLGLRETRSFVHYRIQQASDEYQARHPFTPGAILALHQATGGYPRKIINLCHRVLLQCIVQNRSRATRAMVLSCAGKRDRVKWAVSFAAAATLVLIVTAVSGWNPFAGQPESAHTTAVVSLPEPALSGQNNASGKVAAGSREKIAERAIPRDAASARVQQRPLLLGRVEIRKGDISSHLIRGVYGRFTPAIARAVAAANPNIEDFDLLPVGVELLFPPLPDMAARPEGAMRVLSLHPELSGAVSGFRNLGYRKDVFVLPVDQGKGFALCQSGPENPIPGRQLEGTRVIRSAEELVDLF